MRLAPLAPLLASGRALPHHLGRVLVAAQALEPRVAQLPGGGPLAEPDLPDQLGLDPVHARRGGSAPPVERRLRPLQRGQAARCRLRQQRVGRSRCRPCPRRPAGRRRRSSRAAARRTRSASPAGRCKPPMTNSWPLSHLNFSQSLVRPARYGASARLATRPSQPWRRPLVVRLAVGVAVLGVPQRPVEGQQAAQDPLALAQRQRPDVLAVGPQHVEQVVEHRHRGAQRPRLGWCTPSRCCSRLKLVSSPSKATTSPSTTKSRALAARPAPRRSPGRWR